MKEVITEIKRKLDSLDSEREELEEKLEYKRFQLQKVNSLISKLENLQERDEQEG